MITWKVNIKIKHLRNHWKFERQEVFSCFLQGPGLHACTETTSGQSWPFIHPRDGVGSGLALLIIQKGKNHKRRFLGPGTPKSVQKPPSLPLPFTASIKSTSHQVLGGLSPRPRGGKAPEVSWYQKQTLHRPTPWKPLRLREFGTWEVNSLIKTVQNPNFAEWQFGGEKKNPAMGKCWLCSTRHSVLRGSIIKTLIQLFLFKWTPEEEASMVLKVCGYYWINVSPIKEIIIHYLCTFKLTPKRSLWRIAAAASFSACIFLSPIPLTL